MTPWHGFCVTTGGVRATGVTHRAITGLLRSKKVIALGVIIALVVGVRVALPTVIQRYANRTLDELEGYSGPITDAPSLTSTSSCFEAPIRLRASAS